MVVPSLLPWLTSPSSVAAMSTIVVDTTSSSAVVIGDSMVGVDTSSLHRRHCSVVTKSSFQRGRTSTWSHNRQRLVIIGVGTVPAIGIRYHGQVCVAAVGNNVSVARSSDGVIAGGMALALLVPSSSAPSASMCLCGRRGR